MLRIGAFISGFATEVTLAALKVVAEAIRDRLPSALVSDRLKVDGSGVTQPISGTVTANIGTAGSLALDASITALRGQITAALGQAARAASLGVTLSTEDAAKVPALGQAPAADSIPVVLTAIQVAQLAQESGGNLATTATNTGTLAGVVNSGAAITKQKAGTSYNSAALEKSAVISASAASPAIARMWNAGGSTRFLQLHDANALPANGAIPDDVVSVGTAAAALPIVLPIPSNGYATGVVAACSTTAATLTITGTNDALFSVILFPSGS